uniref:cytochrome P450 11C1 n=1 Tax=Monopterus albus TaxID=43700 RepID=UPI0009B4CA2B|nr:cytochrome P450 11B, mitochondrial-like [Monopterus albus]
MRTQLVCTMRSMYTPVTVCVRAQGTCGSTNLLCGVMLQRAFCMTAAETVAKSERSKGVRKRGVDGRVRRFEEIPHTGRSGWINLLKFWREGRFGQIHKHMERTFSALGPIYREHVATQSSVNIFLPSDIGELFRSEGLYPERMTVQPWVTHREIRHHSKGVFLKNGEEWRADRLLLNKEVMMNVAVQRFLPHLDEVARDFCRMLQARVEKEGRVVEGKQSLTIEPSSDLFRFGLEAICHVLYGERMGLFSSSPSMESQKFIWALKQMLATTNPLLYLPHRLLLRVGAPLWVQHASAWDYIFSHADVRIQRGYQRQSSSRGRRSEAGAAGDRHTGVLGQLLEKGQLSMDLIKANMTELMVGGVDTTAVPLQFALFELARNPEVQEKVRQQVIESWAQAAGDLQKALQGVPLLKGTVKETLRYIKLKNPSSGSQMGTPGIMQVFFFLLATCIHPHTHISSLFMHPVASKFISSTHHRAHYGWPQSQKLTMVQVCLYPLGRSAEVFDDPERFDPERWCSIREGGQRPELGFRFMAFGLGARQCVGRRIAENQMQLLLMRVLLSFHLSVQSSEDVKTTFAFLLQPETPPRITFSRI